jgi:DNA-binding transcriptional MerR regulator
MFRIGEFAQIAQVSTRQLRFYDELGLLQPAHIDRTTGYRFYSVKQLPQLNSILALKDLGFSLDEIAPLLKDAISPSELRGMLTLKRAEALRALKAEEARLRHIESRIAQIDTVGAIAGYDVVTKSVEVMPVLSLRATCSSFDEVVRAVCSVAEGGRQIRPGLRDKLFVVSHNEDESEDLDLEIGYSLTRASNANLKIADGLVLLPGKLAPVETMATIVRQGTNVESHKPFSAIGAWIEANNYAIAGPCRELFLEPVTGLSSFEGALVEIQFPIR